MTAAAHVRLTAYALASVLASSCVLLGPPTPEFMIIDPDETCRRPYRGYPKGIPRRIAKDICGPPESMGAFMDAYGNCWIGPDCDLLPNWEVHEPGEPWCWDYLIGEPPPRLPLCSDIGVKIEF